MKTLIIGAGEVGISLYRVLKPYYPVTIKDKEKLEIKGIEILHICFPYSKDFIKKVREYQKEYKPKYTIIHSTVKIGTSKKLDAVHSPVVGIHPYLEQSLKTFIKFLGGEKAGEVADYFRRAGIKAYITGKSETTELTKILSTTKYGLDISFTKEVKRLCEENKVPFEFWTLWNKNYNFGYEKLGYPEYQRPELIPIMKKIKGHCVSQNLKLLKTKFNKLIG